MELVNNIPTGLRVPAPAPLDSKLYVLTYNSLESLGLSNNLAYSYYKGMVVYCVETDKYYKWRPKVGSEVGTLTEDFTYPNPFISNGITYSGQVYNFFPVLQAEDIVIPTTTVYDANNVGVGAEIYKNTTGTGPIVFNFRSLIQEIVGAGQGLIESIVVQGDEVVIKNKALGTTNLNIYVAPDGTVMIDSPETSSEISPNQVLSSVGINFHTKDGGVSNFSRPSTMLPEGVTKVTLRNGFMVNTLPTVSGNSVVYKPKEGLTEIKVRNLWIDIVNWDLIENFNPTLVISRYRYGKDKGRSNITNSTHYRKSGYKINNSEDPEIAPLRPAKIPLTSQKSIIDFGQEHYFSTNTTAEGDMSRCYSRGIKKHFKRISNTGDRIPFVYFELRLEIEVAGEKYLSKGLTRFRMEFRPKKENRAHSKIILRQV